MVQVSYFDGIEIPHDARADEFTDADRATAAMSAFLALTPADRLADSPHVWAYYRDYYEMVGGQDWLDAEMGVPAGPEGIWVHVHPQQLYLSMRDGDPACYVVVDCNCDWEQEHGLMLVWRDGKRLTKVGGFDGHVTNVDAYDDPAYADVVYAASAAEYVTRLDAR